MKGHVGGIKCSLPDAVSMSSSIVMSASAWLQLSALCVYSYARSGKVQRG